MHRLFHIVMMGITSLFAAPALAEQELGVAKPWQLGFQDPATPVMERLESLHNGELMWIITAVTVFVMVLLLYIIIRFNAKSNPEPSKTSHNTLLEVIWTTIPILILVLIAVPSVKLHYFMNDVPPDADLTLKVTGYQWYWGYEYPDQGVKEYSSNLLRDSAGNPTGEPRLLAVDNEVVVPVDKVVRVQMTAADVIHAWAVPAFGVKMDAVPGKLNETWFKATKTGIFYGQCSELCGVNHGFMPIRVRVVTADEFAAWVESKKEAANVNGAVRQLAALQR
jgi:cytochrome c oxidase subunit 2